MKGNSMTNEFDTVAWLKQKDKHVQVHVTVCYELDGYQPIGVWALDEIGIDITPMLEPDEYDLLVEKAERHAVEYMTETAEMNCEGER